MKEFRFTNFEVRKDQIVYHYSCHLGDSTVTLDVEGIDTLPEQFIGYLGIAFCLHAFRMDHFEKIVIEPISITQNAKQFYETYFLHGLAEYRYVNRFPIDQGVVIESKILTSPKPQTRKVTTREKALLMIGGGKDSLVALELLNKIGHDYDFFIYGKNVPAERAAAQFSKGHTILRCSRTTKYPEGIKRIHGHMPASSLYGFMSAAVAYIHGYKHVVAANEFSANFPNLVHNTFPVNHQYTKSAEFETAFSHFIHEELFDGDYFSILRPLYEIQIAAIFSQLPHYFTHFISCNHASKDETPEWCGTCAKCAFVYLILAPLITPSERQSIWPKNLFEDASICRHVIELATANTNPLECVGTIAESQIGLTLCDRAHLLDNAHPQYRATLQKAAQEVDLTKLRTYVDDIDRPHTIPPEIWKKVRPIFASTVLPVLESALS